MMKSRIQVWIGALAMVAVLATSAAAQTTPTLDGTWDGAVTANSGEMKIEATLTAKAGVVTGSIKTFHGNMTIKEGKLVDGKWVLPFTTEDGLSGKLTGTLKGNEFTGAWDFSPQAVGTFALKRRT